MLLDKTNVMTRSFRLIIFDLLSTLSAAISIAEFFFKIVDCLEGMLSHSCGDEGGKTLVLTDRREICSYPSGKKPHPPTPFPVRPVRHRHRLGGCTHVLGRKRWRSQVLGRKREWPAGHWRNAGSILPSGCGPWARLRTRTHCNTCMWAVVEGARGGGRGGTQISLSVGRMPATPGRCCSAMSSLMTLASAFACWSEGVQAGALKGVFRTQQRAAPQRSPQQRL